MRKLVALLLAGVVLLPVAACSGDDEPAAMVAEAGETEPARLRVPSQIVGLQVTFEEVPSERMAEIERPYVDSVAVFSLREEDELLRATLQVTRLSGQARPESRSFQRQIVQQLGTVTPVERHVAGKTVHATAGTEQHVYVWFEGRGMFVLGIHQDFPFPRTLLRRLLEKDLGV